MSRVMRAARAVGSSVRLHAIGSRMRMWCVPSGRRSCSAVTTMASVRIANFTGPIGVGAGRPKKGTLTLSVACSIEEKGQDAAAADGVDHLARGGR